MIIKFSLKDLTIITFPLNQRFVVELEEGILIEVDKVSQSQVKQFLRVERSEKVLLVFITRLSRQSHCTS